MPISSKYLKIFKSMQKTYCTSKYGKDGIKDKEVQGIPSCPKGRGVFYATMKKRGIDYTKLIISTDITPIIPKVFGTKKKTKKAKFRLLTLIELIVEHAKSHHNKNHELHTQIVSELERRGYPHYETKLDVKPIKEDTDIEYVKLEDVIKAFPPAVVVEQSWCYDSETRVLTKNGLKYFYELRHDDDLMTLDLNSEEIEWQKPVKILEFDYNGSMIKINKRKTVNLLVTPEHRQPLISRYGVKKIIKAKDLKVHSSNKFILTGKWNCSPKEYFNLPEYRNEWIDSWGRNHKYVSIEKRIPIDLWLKFIGYYISEGCTANDKRVEIRQKLYTKEMFDGIKNLPFNVKQFNKGLRIYSKQLVQYVKQFGKAWQKFIPKEFKELPRENLEILLRALRLGDGSKRRDTGWTHYTVSRRLAEDIMEIAIKSGYGVTLNVKDRLGRRRIYLIGIKGERINPILCKSDISEEEYNGKVYSVTVPNGIIMVERKGKLVFSGNSGYITGRIVNDCKIPKGYAIDLVVTQHPDVNIVHAIKTIKPTWLADMIHITFSNEPSVANNIPIYKKGFFKTSMKEQSQESFGKIKPFMKFASLNVKSGQDKYEFNDYTTFYNSWVSKYLDRGIIIQKKYNGRRFSIHKQGDKVQILTEDTRIDRSNEMPNITKEILGIKHDFVLDAIMVAYDSLNKEVKSARIKEKDCERIPIKDTTWANEGKISKEQELSMTFHVHDVLYFDGQAMNEKGYSDRLFEINFIVPNRLQFLSIAYWELVKTPIDLTHTMNRIIKENDSDGIIAKVADSKYNIKTGKENRAQEWSRFNFSNTLKEELSNFKFTTCSYHNEKWCPLEELSNALKDNKSTNLPVTCKLANIYKCYYIKNCFYEDGKNESTEKT